MPQKSVREMSRLEQLHYSLSAKTFHAIWMVSLVLTGTAILMEVLFYRKVVSGLIVNSKPLQDSAHLYLGLYIGVLIAVTFLLGFIMVFHFRKNLVLPIRQLTDAAYAYAEHRGDGQKSPTYFRDLQIRTGDELEGLSLVMADMERELESYIKSLSAVTAEKERIGTELSIASQIQEGMLPGTFPAFPERQEFEIYASMTAAKEVGGDFYDFFLIDDDHLALVIADVSGKGVPAALFMMASKILIKNIAILSNSPAYILENVNHQICLNNSANMFVTTWLGILEISTGIFRAANAGHEYPTLQKSGSRFKLVRDTHGFVLGGMDGMRYAEYELALQKGDCIFLYTDGVPEASDKDNQLFGTKRMLEALNRHPDAAPKELLRNVSESIREFAGDAPQFDDITMLCLRYQGNSTRKLTIEARVDNLDLVQAFVNKELSKAGCSEKVKYLIDLSVEELFVNIAHYAYTSDSNKVVIGVTLQENPKAVIITFADNGIPYNPLKAKSPDLKAAPEERSEGGLGIYLARKSMDDMQYRYRDGQNLLTITKYL